MAEVVTSDAKTTVKESKRVQLDDTFTSEQGDEPGSSEEYAKEAKSKATPAVCKRRQATRHLVVQSPTDHNFSPCSQKLLQKKRTSPVRDF